MQPFTETQQDMFFGREREIEAAKKSLWPIRSWLLLALLEPASRPSSLPV